MKELIGNEILKLPKERKNEFIFEFVSRTLKEYETFLDSTDENTFTAFEFNGMRYTKELLINLVSILCNGINEALSLHSYESPYRAFVALKQSLDEVDLIDKIDFKLSTSGRYFYRMRNNVPTSEINKETQKLSIESLLHHPIVFENKAGYERFSIKHIPALYLSNSLYGCYLELGLKPNNINNCYVSMAEFESPNIKLFDLRVRNEIIENVYNANFQEKFAYLLMYPLIFTCSIIKTDTDDEKKPEYIIPQLFIEWIKEQNNNINFFGIAYSSTKINQTNVDKPSLFYNVVIPTIKPTDKHDYCEVICDNLRLTEPIRFLDHFFRTKPDMNGCFFDSNIPGKEHLNSNIYNTNNNNILYEASGFGNVEKILDKHKLYNL